MTKKQSAAPVVMSAIPIPFLLVMGVVFCVAQTTPQVAEPVQQMTEATVVQMVQARISPDLIILAISKCNPKFALDPGSTQYMTQIGVTDEILKAMAAKQNGQPMPAVQPTDYSVLNGLQDALVDLKAAVAVGVTRQDYQRQRLPFGSTVKWASAPGGAGQMPQLVRL